MKKPLNFKEIQGFWWRLLDSNQRKPAAARLLPHFIRSLRFAQRAFGAGRSLVRDKLPLTNKKTVSFDTVFLLVDDTGLEPVTLRTSSGCSYQLS